MGMAKKRVLRQHWPLALAPCDLTDGEYAVSTSAEKRAIPNRSSTTICRGSCLLRRRTRPVWTSVRGAAVKAVSPVKRGRSAATRLDGGEHTRTLVGLDGAGLPQHLVVGGEREARAFLRSPTDAVRASVASPARTLLDPTSRHFHRVSPARPASGLRAPDETPSEQRGPGGTGARFR